MFFLCILFLPYYVLLLLLLRIIGHKDRPVAQPILLFSLSTVLTFQFDLPFRDSLYFLITSYHVKQGCLRSLFPSEFCFIIFRIRVDSNLVKSDQPVLMFYFGLNLTCSVPGRVSLASFFFIYRIYNLLLIQKFSVGFYLKEKTASFRSFFLLIMFL